MELTNLDTRNIRELLCNPLTQRVPPPVHIEAKSLLMQPRNLLVQVVEVHAPDLSVLGSNITDKSGCYGFK